MDANTEDVAASCGLCGGIGCYRQCREDLAAFRACANASSLEAPDPSDVAGLKRSLNLWRAGARDANARALNLSKQLTARLGVETAIAETLGGKVEDRPTSTVNYLQRARALVALECEIQAVFKEERDESNRQAEVCSALDDMESARHTHIAETLERIALRLGFDLTRTR